ncbi:MULTISPECIES: RNA polymerase sigma factor [Butyricimonas]|uniref:RNA polymerase sigma factor n=1 Tax=Butyricimonas TaxID=574697 RepID=UPI001D072716|nr:MULTISPECIES: sigma-70 family RNA polymerase sigma factor [Butyricimonas]MCB6974181.1 sigma-70 family RNA polymerase sigma factor [Butyricimonas synergistica]MCG4521022.1 sigma-70 family RNA polymerase sigma factor [Butyricimonas sp. DFI.6.44]
MELDTLLQEIQKDNRKAFDELVLQYNESLNAFAFNILKDKEAAEDIVQDVFVNLWLNRKKITFGESTKSLLYVSTRNLVYNYIRSAKRENERYKHLTEENESSTLNYIIQEEALRLLNESIEQLPPRMAEVIRLSLEGLKQEEIAEQMEVTVANVKRLKALGIEKLKKSLGTLSCFVFTTTGLI